MGGCRKRPEAAKLKAMYIKHRAAAQNLIERVDSGAVAYAWARNPENIGAVKSSLAEVEASLTEFSKEYMLGEQKKLRERWGSSTMAEIEKYLETKKVVDRLGHSVKTILLMHSKRA